MILSEGVLNRRKTNESVTILFGPKAWRHATTLLTGSDRNTVMTTRICGSAKKCSEKLCHKYWGFAMPLRVASPYAHFA